MGGLQALARASLLICGSVLGCSHGTVPRDSVTTTQPSAAQGLPTATSTAILPPTYGPFEQASALALIETCTELEERDVVPTAPIQENTDAVALCESGEVLVDPAVHLDDKGNYVLPGLQPSARGAAHWCKVPEGSDASLAAVAIVPQVSGTYVFEADAATTLALGVQDSCGGITTHSGLGDADCERDYESGGATDAGVRRVYAHLGAHLRYYAILSAVDERPQQLTIYPPLPSGAACDLLPLAERAQRLCQNTCDAIYSICGCGQTPLVNNAQAWVGNERLNIRLQLEDPERDVRPSYLALELLDEQGRRLAGPIDSFDLGDPLTPELDETVTWREVFLTPELSQQAHSARLMVRDQAGNRSEPVKITLTPRTLRGPGEACDPEGRTDECATDFACFAAPGAPGTCEAWSVEVFVRDGAVVAHARAPTAPFNAEAGLHIFGVVLLPPELTPTAEPGIELSSDGGATSRGTVAGWDRRGSYASPYWELVSEPHHVYATVARGQTRPLLEVPVGEVPSQLESGAACDSDEILLTCAVGTCAAQTDGMFRCSGG